MTEETTTKKIQETTEETEEYIFDPKHYHPIPLSKTWTFYAHTCSGSDTYNESYISLGEVTTMQEWGAMMNHLVSADILVSTDKQIYMGDSRIVSYSMFCDNIKPSWEHPSNIKGKEWGCREYILPEDAHTIWVNLCAQAALENINATGIRVLNKTNAIRSISKLEVWMSKDISSTLVSSQIYDTLKTIKLVGDIPSFSLLNHVQKKNDAVNYYHKQVNNRRRRKNNNSNYQNSELNTNIDLFTF